MTPPETETLEVPSEATDAAEEKVVAVGAEEDAWLEANDGVDGDDPSPEPVQASLSAAPGATEAQPAVAESAGSEAQSEDAGVESEPGGADLAPALAALKRYGLTDEAISDWSAERITSVGERYAKMQSDVDSMAADLKNLKESVGSSAPADKSEPSEGSETSGTPDQGAKTELTPEGDIVIELDEALLKPLTDELGEDAAKALIGAVRGVVEPLAKQVHQQTEAAQAGTAAQQAKELEVIRGELVGTSPQLKDDDAWGKVIGKAEQIASSYSDPRECLRDATALVYGAPAEGSADMGEAALRDRGQATRTAKNQKPPASMTPDEQEDMALSLLDQGATMEEVRAKLGMA